MCEMKDLILPGLKLVIKRYELSIFLLHGIILLFTLRFIFNPFLTLIHMDPFTINLTSMLRRSFSIRVH